jgi:hypothetical protein
MIDKKKENELGFLREFLEIIDLKGNSIILAYHNQENFASI